MNKIFKSTKNYFDLNKNVKGEDFIEHIRLRSPELEKETPSKTTAKKQKLITQIFLYVGIFLGVLFSDFVYQYQSGLSNFHLPIAKIIFSLAIAICLIPIVYDKLKINPSSHFMYQFAFFFQQGILWKTIFQLF